MRGSLLAGLGCVPSSVGFWTAAGRRGGGSCGQEWNSAEQYGLRTVGLNIVSLYIRWVSREKHAKFI